MPAPPDLLSIETVADRAQVSSRTVRRWIASGALFSVRVGRRRLVPVEAYESWRAALIERAAS